MSNYTIYKANYNPRTDYLHGDPLWDTFDQGNPYSDNRESLTANNKYERVVHASIDHLFYKQFYTNTKASFGTGNINNQFRYLEDQAYVISLPQSKFGEAVMPRSVDIKAKWSIAVLSGSYYTSGSVTEVTGEWNISDDGFGNLKMNDGEYYSPYGQFIGGAYTNYSSSITRQPVGEWPLDELYKYTDVGPVSFTSSFNKGMWMMESIYSNISVTSISGNTAPYPTDVDLLGAVMHFTASLSSSLQIKPNAVDTYREKYNFENQDYAISMMVRPTQKPTHPSGSVLISKQSVVDVIGLDINGNTMTYSTPNNAPYRLTYTSESCKIKFERDAGGDFNFALTSSVSMSLNTLYHVTATRSGSTVTLHVNSAYENSIDMGTVVNCDIDSRNLSNIFVGNSYKLDQGFNGTIDNIKIYNKHLDQNEVNILHHTLGVGNTHVGNAFYNQGMFTLTSIPSRFCDILSVSSRGTTRTWETEVSCTVSPGEFMMSSNPTLLENNPIRGEYVCKKILSGSDFKPFVTAVGLYDDYGRLLMVGKLSQPIQLPDNVDTTFIIRYDR